MHVLSGGTCTPGFAMGVRVDGTVMTFWDNGSTGEIVCSGETVLTTSCSAAVVAGVLGRMLAATRLETEVLKI